MNLNLKQKRRGREQNQEVRSQKRKADQALVRGEKGTAKEILNHGSA